MDDDRPLPVDAEPAPGAAVSAAQPSTDRNRTLLLSALLAAATCLCYANSFKGVFLFDDESAIVDNETIRALWPPRAVFEPPPNTTVSGRPLVNLTLAVNFALGGFDPRGYHAVNLAFHLLTGLVIFGIVRRALRAPVLAGRFGARADSLAFFIALIWLVHPLQTESVTYIVQRAESLVGLFYCLTLYAVLRGARSMHPARWTVAAVTACVLGMFSKEVMATAPFVVYAFDALLLCDGRFRAPIFRRRGLYPALAATLVIPIWLIVTNPRGDSAGFGAAAAPTSLEYLASQPGVILHYLKLSFYPARLCLDYAWPIATSLGDILPPALVVAALAIGTLWATIRRRPVAALGIWFFAILAPTSSFVPIVDLAFEHRMYLPLAAVVAFVVLGTYRVASLRGRQRATQSRHWALALVGAALAVGLGFKTHERNGVYASAIGMWTDVTAKRPRNPRGHHNLAHALRQAGDIEGAIASFRRAIAVSDRHESSRNDLGVILSERGENTSGLALVRAAIDLAPNKAEFYYNLGIILARMGRDDEAIAAYRRCLELDPGYADAQYNLGNIALRRGDYAAAAAEFRKALEHEPDHVRANYNLGGILQMSGDRASAERRFDRAFAAAMRRGLERAQLERWADAEDAFRSALQVRPGAANARYHLARSLAAQGEIDAAIDEAAEAVRLDATDEAAAELLRGLIKLRRG